MEEIIAFLKKYDRFAVFTHLNPDGDALGSAFSLASALKNWGKAARVVLLDRPAEKYDFDEFRPLFCLLSEMDPADYDACISVDCADAQRLSKAKDAFFTHPGLNIDHHISNTRFARTNYVEDAPSTGEIIYDIMGELGVAADTTARMALYMAISTDTGNFTYPNTTPKTLRICSQLVSDGLDISYVANRIYNNRTLGATRLICTFIDHLRLHYGGKFAISVIMLQDIADAGAEVADSEILINYARDVDTVEIAAFLRELKKDTYKLSLRSKSNADVAAFAARYGGGGHVRAAGCMMRGDLYDILQEVLKTAGEYLD